MNIRQSFYIISAFRHDLPDENNVWRHKGLWRALNKAGLYPQHSEVEGKYKGKTELAFKVPVYDPVNDEQKILTIARRFFQESVLHVDANWQAYLVYTDNGRVQHIGRWINIEERYLQDTDDYARIDGQYYVAI